MTQHQDITELMETWTRSQQQLWESWMDTVRKAATAGMQAPDLNQGMQSWQTSVNHTLDTQAQAMQAWASQVSSVEGASPEAKRWAEEGARMLEQWTAAQRGLWQQWFQMMGQAMQGSAGQPGGDQLKQLMSGWEQVGQQMQELQKNWADSFAPGKKS